MSTQPQNIVYYDGVPYISTAPSYSQNQNFWGAPTYGMMNYNLGMGTAGMYGNRNNMYGRGLDFDTMMARGWLTPLNPVAPTVNRPPPAMTQMPEAGWGNPAQSGGGSASLDAILNGAAPQFAAAPGPAAQPQQGQMPPPAQGTPTPGMPQMASALPNPRAPQQNFDALGKNLMNQVLNPGGM